MIKIYLCGPIMDLSHDEASTWRNEVKKNYNEQFIFLDPMRRNFRDEEYGSRNEIVQLDKADIIASDVVLVNATKPSWGTAMEVLFAYSKHKIIIAFNEGGYVDASPWLAYHSTKIVYDVYEAIDYIQKHI